MSGLEATIERANSVAQPVSHAALPTSILWELDPKGPYPQSTGPEPPGRLQMARSRPLALPSEAATAGKSCTIELITGDGSGYESPAKTGKVEGSAVSCAADAAFVYTGGGTEWTVTMVSGVAGDPVEAASAGG